MTKGSSFSLFELERVIPGLVLPPSVDVHLKVHSVTDHAAQVEPGSLFVARRGAKVDGLSFLPEAIARGAVAVLTRDPVASTIANCTSLDPLRTFGHLAQFLAGSPSHDLKVLGVTGTNGKTTTTELMASALERLGHRVAKLGTLGFFIDGKCVAPSLTTPMPYELAQHFQAALAAGCTHLVMEVSSHALHQGRVAGVRFQVAGFTNLTPDHLDYHQTMEAYGAAKTLLFTECAPLHSVVTVDSDFGRSLAAKLPSALTVSAFDSVATLSARAAQLSPTGISAEVRGPWGTSRLESRLIGRHNLENLLLAFGMLTALGEVPGEVSRALAEAALPRGRLQPVDVEGNDLVVLVDYAHTPDALSRVLSAVRSVSSGLVYCVFGCGGDRDRKKRPEMGRAVANLADVAVLTTDNPRTEDPGAIISEIRPGLEGGRAEAWEIIDREEAIFQAILRAPPGSVVLLAGKGHEDYQILGQSKVPFDDREVAQRALLERGIRRRAVQ